MFWRLLNKLTFRIRTSTFERLIQLKNGLLTKLLIEAMKSDPIAPVLHKKHIEAINRRMPIIFQHIQACVNRYVTCTDYMSSSIITVNSLVLGKTLLLWIRGKEWNPEHDNPEHEIRNMGSGTWRRHSISSVLNMHLLGKYGTNLTHQFSSSDYCLIYYRYWH